MDKRSSSAFRASNANIDAPFLDPIALRSEGMGIDASHSRSGGDAFVLAADFPAVIDLASLDGDNGFRIDGAEEGDESGVSVSGAGDVNGDGIDDMIIGARFATPDGDARTGAAYVVFGTSDGFDASFDLATLDGGNGFRLDGVRVGDWAGVSVSAAGDVNGDGFDDVMVGAQFGAPDGKHETGAAYVVFGNSGGFDASLDLAALDGTDGFRIEGIKPYDYAGYSVSSAGDVNGDGFDDVIVGARKSDAGGYHSGQSYVVFGQAGGFAASLDLASLDGSNGFRVDGIDPDDQNGVSVSSAGDVNGDGFDDIVIGAPGAEPGGDRYAGESYVVFGHAGGFAAGLDLATLDGTNGFRIDGVDPFDFSGYSVSAAGDINGDGFGDVIIGATGGDTGGVSAGESYVVFGKSDGFAASLDLSTLDGSNGFRVDGADAYDFSGTSVSSAGDVNGDGFDDMLVAALDNKNDNAGATYVVFGHSGGFTPSFDLASLDGTNGFRLDGIDSNDESGGSAAAAGDVNGDGFADIIIGAHGGDPDGVDLAGESYVVFGRAPTEGVIRIGSEADQTIRGGDFNDLLRGKQGDDVLIGGEGDNWLRGGHGADELVGGSAVDRMNGGDGHDSVMGGAGADVFVLASVSAHDSDTLLDFAPGEDRIALGGKAFGLAEGLLDPAAFVIGGAAGDADDRLIYDDATGNLFFDADGTGASAQVLIATLAGAPPLAASDIFVV